MKSVSEPPLTAYRLSVRDRLLARPVLLWMLFLLAVTAMGIIAKWLSPALRPGPSGVAPLQVALQVGMLLLVLPFALRVGGDALGLRKTKQEPRRAGTSRHDRLSPRGSVSGTRRWRGQRTHARRGPEDQLPRRGGSGCRRALKTPGIPGQNELCVHPTSRDKGSRVIKTLDPFLVTTL